MDQIIQEASLPCLWWINAENKLLVVISFPNKLAFDRKLASKEEVLQQIEIQVKVCPPIWPLIGKCKRWCKRKCSNLCSPHRAASQSLLRSLTVTHWLTESLDIHWMFNESLDMHWLSAHGIQIQSNYSTEDSTPVWWTELPVYPVNNHFVNSWSLVSPFLGVDNDPTICWLFHHVSWVVAFSGV